MQYVSYTCHMEVELAKCKLDLIQHQEACLAKDNKHLQKEEECKAAEHFFRQQEEALKATEQLFKKQEEACKSTEHLFRQPEQAGKATEHLFKQQEEAHNAREILFNKWERIQLYIRELNRASGNETNEIIKCDMEADIIVLINRKNHLANRLNFTKKIL